MLRRQLLASTAIALMLTSRSEAREISGQMPCSAGAAGLPMTVPRSFAHLRQQRPELPAVALHH
jgi:hypothetical protein